MSAGSNVELKERIMFLNNITWSDYIFAIVTCTVLYYLFVAIRYYATDIRDFAGRRRNFSFQRHAQEVELKVHSQINPVHEDEDFEVFEDEQFDEIELLIGEIKSLVAISGTNDFTSQDFRRSLQNILISYPDIKYSPFRSSINELIVSECEKSSAVTLSESAVDELWESSTR